MKSNGRDFFFECFSPSLSLFFPLTLAFCFCCGYFDSLSSNFLLPLLPPSLIFFLSLSLSLSLLSLSLSFSLSSSHSFLSLLPLSHSFFFLFFRISLLLVGFLCWSWARIGGAFMLLEHACSRGGCYVGSPSWERFISKVLSKLKSGLLLLKLQHFISAGVVFLWFFFLFLVQSCWSCESGRCNCKVGALFFVFGFFLVLLGTIGTGPETTGSGFFPVFFSVQFSFRVLLVQFALMEFCHSK